MIPFLMSLIYRSTPIKMLISLMFNYLWLIPICFSINFLHATEEEKITRTLFVVIIFNHAVEAYHSLFWGSGAGLSGNPHISNNKHTDLISTALFSLHMSDLHRLIEILDFPKNMYFLVKLDTPSSFIAIQV